MSLRAKRRNLAPHPLPHSFVAEIASSAFSLLAMTRCFFVALSLTLLAALCAVARAQSYPVRPVEIVVPYGAGGSTDLVARTIAQQLQTRLKQSVVVLNKPGGAGTIAVMSVMRAAPDGYTLLLGFTTELGVMPHMSKAAKYSMADFTPIAVTGDVPLVMIGAQRLQSNSLKDLLAEIRAAPGKFNYGGGLGSPSHISG